MSAKIVTFQLLDKMPHGTTFTGGSLAYHVQTMTNEYHYPATILRYVRQWRHTHRIIKCLNNKKSLYQIIGRIE